MTSPVTSLANEELLTLPEAASLLKLRLSTMRAWVLRRKLPYVKVGRCVRIRHSDIDALIAAGSVPAREVRR